MRQAAVLVFAMLTAGCASIWPPVDIYRSDIEKPYQKLGVLEVKLDTWQAYTPLQASSRVLTLGLYRPTRKPDVVKKSLDAVLKRKAYRYGADAVIKVEYYPDPREEIFKTGELYGRGEMVLYRKDQFTY